MWIRRRRAGAVGQDDLVRRLTTLAEVLDRAILAQPNAEEVINECCRPGETPADVARRGGRVISEFAYLHESVRSLFGPQPGSLPSRIAELLLWHAETVEECLKLAFPRFWNPAAVRHGHTHRGLGEHGRTLRESRVAVQMWIDTLSDVDGSG
ncbi:hypothetical protein [Actinocrispum sp. NPDC049592]|uniref:hypothetical protein n=1 Tax=Actinocrispum sp. NPDC049592 TaxID=3154835 RepID=UPI00342B6A41